MCTSFVVNKGNKTLVGWNLDILDMQYRVRTDEKGVFIEINDEREGWMPLFGANDRGDFVGMPTCWPFDQRSDPKGEGENILMLDIDLLTEKKTFSEVQRIAETRSVFSIPSTTFMSALSDRDGNVLYIIPGQGCQYMERPEVTVMTNFSPFKMDSEKHPWMGWDRYVKAKKMLEEAGGNISVGYCFEVLKSVAQEICPTVVSMVFDVTEMKVYWCENRNWNDIRTHSFAKD